MARRYVNVSTADLDVLDESEDSSAEGIGEKLLISKENPYRKRLKLWNTVVAIVQFISFAALLTISLVRLSDAKHVGLWLDVDRGMAIRDLGTYPLFATLLPFPFITAIFHLLARANVDDYYNQVLNNGTNRLRWIEYSITNGLMTFSLCVLAGARGVVLLVVNLLANCLMQAFGYFHENLVHSQPPGSRTPKYILFGFLPWLQTWITVITYYAVNFSTATLSDGFAIIGSLLLSLAFVFPLVWYYGKPNFSENNYRLEMMYIFLSLTAKLYLDWTVVIGNWVETS